MATSLLEAVAGVADVAPKAILEFCEGRDPLIFKLLDLSVDLLVLLVGDLHDWPFGDNFLEFSVKITGDALSEVDSSLKVVLLVVNGTHSAQSSEYRLDGCCDLLHVHRVKQLVDWDVLQDVVVVLRLCMLGADLSIIAESKDHAPVHRRLHQDI